MDTHDAPQPSLPEPSLPARLPVLRRSTPSPLRPQVVADAPPLTIQVAIRGVLRHWWQILALWSVVTLALVSVIYVRIKPYYESSSWLRVEPMTVLFGASPAENFYPYLETQVQLITSPTVLTAAAADKEVVKLPRIKTAPDAESELRSAISAYVIGGTYLIRVSSVSKSPTEAATIVNAVVNSYMREANSWDSHATTRQMDKLRDYYRQLEEEAKRKEDEWRRLVKKGTVDPGEALNNIKPQEGEAEDADDAAGRGGVRPRRSARMSITLEECRRVREQLVQVGIDLIQAEALLAMLQAEADGTAPVDNDLRLKAQVEEAFRSDPDAVRLYEQMEKIDSGLEKLTRSVRNPSSDPSVVAARRSLEGVKAKIERLWEAKEPMLRARLVANGGGGGVAEAAAQVSKLRIQKASLESMLSQIEVRQQKEGSDVVDMALVQEALDGLREMKAAVKRRLYQLNFDSKGNARIVLLSEARPNYNPLGDKRKKYMAAAPVGVMVALLGLFVLLEVKSGRVGTPDELSARTHLEVYGLPVMPGSPASRSMRSRSREEQLSVFVQSLDHLRVALFGEASAGSCHCVTITSAIGGEGKTTLTAQLAARCATAGLSTLVIDADLRRASLSRMLEVTGAPGLADVLKGEITAEEALVPVQAGGFHLLPAGTRDPDPGRILQVQGLEQVLAQLRETFDIVLIDTPPVLPVPDALILGRLTDGVVLAARNTASRSQLVDRTNKRLANAGIPVLGVVLSGVEITSLYYGGYTYNHETA
jgi:polysaccharide biosynthesis transport protein